MNFVFIIDTSWSMSQTFDRISYFDCAKSAIQSFVFRRELNNTKSKNLLDRYFLVTLNEDLHKNILCSWANPSEHFIYQLKAWKIGYDFTCIDTAIKTSFNLLNHLRKIGFEKHIYGRSFSNIQNSFIIIITDGGLINNNKKVIKNETNLNWFNTTLNEDGNTNWYNELYRWDQSIYSIILGENSKNNISSYKILNQYSKLVGGKIYTAANLETLNKCIIELADKVFLNNRVYVNFNLLPEGSNSANSSNKMIIPIEYPNQISNLTEHWPFPDELVINKEMKQLPLKKATPMYTVSTQPKYNFSVSPEYYDEYHIKDKKIILKWLSNSPMWTTDSITDAKRNIYYEVSGEGNTKQIPNRPFAVIMIKFTQAFFEDIQQPQHSNITLYNYFTNDNAKYLNILNNYLICCFILLPYNYKEFNNIMKKHETNAISKAEFQIQLEKYMSTIPFYYKLYIMNYLNWKKILLVESDSYIGQLEKNNIHENVLREIIVKSKNENDKYVYTNKEYNKNKLLHMNKTAKCCLREELYKNNNKPWDANGKIITDNATEQSQCGCNVNEYNSFITSCLNINQTISFNSKTSKTWTNKIILNETSNADVLKTHPVTKMKEEEKIYEVDIELMGDFRETLSKANVLHDITVNEEEIKYWIVDWFGNQFRPRKEMYSSYNVANTNKSDINPNIEDSIYTNTTSEEPDQGDNASDWINKKINRNEMKPEKGGDTRDNSEVCNLSVDEQYFESSIRKEFTEYNPFIDGCNDNNDIGVKNKMVKFTMKYDISDDRLFDWKFNKEIKRFSREWILGFQQKINLEIIVRKILGVEGVFKDSQQKIKFWNRIEMLSEKYGIDKVTKMKLKNIKNIITFSK